MNDKKKYGYVRKIVHCNIKDFKCVTVGKTSLLDKQWLTFPDFLMDYFKIVLGKEWWDQNVFITETEQHPIIDWNRKIVQFQNMQKINSNGFYKSEPNSAMKSYLLLAYDLYTIAHNYELHNKVIKRLRNKKEFQGALFELFVASLFIRAGFKINYSNESDPSEKHPEFFAEIPQTNQLIAVEAKSRHRKGLLGIKGETKEKMKMRVTKLINSAFKKSPNQPFIIFIDLNLPKNRKNQHNNFNQFISEFNKSYKKNSISEKFNFIFITDHHPCSFKDCTTAFNFNDPIIAISSNPKYEIKESDLVFSRLNKSISQYGNIPNLFSEMDYDNSVTIKK